MSSHGDQESNGLIKFSDSYLEQHICEVPQVRQTGLRSSLDQASRHQMNGQKVEYVEPEQPKTIDIHDSRVPRRTSSFPKTKFMLFITLTSTVMFAVVLWYVEAFSAPTAIRSGQAMHRILKVDMGSALAVLRVTQGFLSTLITIALMKALEMLQWALAGRAQGLGSNVFLSLSPTTPIMEVFRIVISRRSNWIARIWGLIRMVLVVVIWVAAILLFVKTSVVVAYDSATEYNVTAGVGQFNRTYIPRSIEQLHKITPEYPYEIVPFSAISSVYSLVGNSIYTTNAQPIDCDSCDSYLLSGGVIMATPWIPSGYEAYPLVNIDKLPVIQVQFKRTMNETETFQDGDCNVFGRTGFIIGIKMCVAKSKTLPGSMIAGVYVCINGTDHGECERPMSRPNLTTTMSVFDRTVDLVASRLNYSISTVIENGPAVKNSAIDIAAFRDGLAWFLDFNASATPPPSSFAEPFWSGKNQLKDASSSSELMRLLQSMLAFPLWYFQPNNYGNPDLDVENMIDGLPSAFYTKARITRPYMRINIDREMFIAFVVLHGVVLLFIWGVLLWVWITRPTLPKLSSYPLVDFAFKSREVSHSGDGFGPSSHLMIAAGDKDIRHTFGVTRVTLRENNSSHKSS